MPTLSKDRILPDAIKQLRLCSALRNCGRVKVEDVFDKSDDENLYVYDDQSLVYSDWMNVIPTAFMSKTFHDQNPNITTLVLLPLDGCIITGKNITKGGICDCALLTDKEMSLVEFKTNVLSTNNLTILQRATEAKDQLWHTYQSIIYRECCIIGISITLKVSIDFYVVFDNDLSVTGVRADFQNLQNEFLQNNHFPLFFESNKQFA